MQPGTEPDPVPDRFNAARHLLAENAAKRGDRDAPPDPNGKVQSKHLAEVAHRTEGEFHEHRH